MAESERKSITLDDLERRHMSDHREPYFNWIRFLVTLSTTTLTALIALQSQYIPLQPVLLPCLIAAWSSLLAAIALGIYAIREEWAAPIRAAARIRSARNQFGDRATAAMIQQAPSTPSDWKHLFAVRWQQRLIVAALFFLCVFAVGNLEKIGTNLQRGSTQTAPASPTR